MLNGFYAGYMSAEGYGLALFVFKKNHIVGSDAGGVKFDGKFEMDLKSKEYVGDVEVSAPPNTDLIQGVNSGPRGLTYKVKFTMPENFLESPFIKVTTPFGAVNIRLEKLRDLGDAE